MILLSNKNLEVNSKLNLEKIKGDFSFNLINNEDLNSEIFFHKILIPIDWGDGKEDYDLVNDLYTVCYDIELFDEEIQIINKINLNKYIKNIFNTLLNSAFNLNSYISTYINDYVTLNPEITVFIKNNRDLILSLFKKSLEDSIYSALSIDSLISNFNIFDKDYLKEIGLLVEKFIDINGFYSKDLLVNLIHIGNKTNSYNTCKLEEILNFLIEEEDNPLPFYSHELSKS